VNEEQLGQVNNVVNSIKAMKMFIKVAEDNLKDKKEALRNLEESIMPDLMEELGLSKIVTHSGAEVAIKEFVRASITRPKEEGGGPDPKALAWLKEHNHGDIIKHEVGVNVGREDVLGETIMEAIQAICAEAGKNLDVYNKETVHWKTLASWVKAQIDAQGELDWDLFKVHTGKTTKITE